MSARSKFFSSGDLRLHYREHGSEDEEAVVLLHGGMDHCRSWDFIAPALARRWKVICPDLRGHGDSDADPSGTYEIDRYVLDLARLIDHGGLAKVRLVGHSLGGNIAIRYASAFPERVERLVAIEGLGPAPDELEERERMPPGRRLREWADERQAIERRVPRDYASVEEATTRMSAQFPSFAPELVRHLTIHGLRLSAPGAWRWKFDNGVRGEGPFELGRGEREALWAAIECPTYLIYGAESWASDPAEDGRAAHFRDAKVVMHEGAGHWVHHDRCEPFLADLLTQLD